METDIDFTLLEEERLRIKTPVEDNIRKKKGQYCIVSTMPRSGTWMNALFFHSYNAFLNNAQIGDASILGFNYYDKLNIAKYHAHSIFPDFQREYTGIYKDDWEKLSFYVDGYNYGNKYIITNRKWFFIKHNSLVKYIYIYRNPLDQAISFFRHSRNHKDTKHHYVLENGKKHYFKDEVDFLLKVGLNSYLKQFLSFYFLKEKYSKILMMLPYENVIRDPEKNFISMLSFLGHPINSARKEKCFRNALEFISMDNLKEFEKQIGHSLANDQQSSKGTHMRGGKIGKWETYFNNKILNAVEKRLSRFGLSLDSFIIN